MVTLVYRARTVGPVCRRLAGLNTDIIALHERELASPFEGVLVRWGSMWPGESEFEINSAGAVRLARDKRQSRLALGDLSPRTWFNRDEAETPCVVRPRRHRAGRKFFVCHHEDQMNDAMRRCGPGWYASELIAKRSEYRVFVLHGRVVCVSERFPPESEPDMVPWNLALGGRLTNVRYRDWPIDVAYVATTAMKRLELDWGAVDIAVAHGRRTVVFEVNTAPGLKNPFTLRQVARTFSWVGKNPGSVPLEDFAFGTGTSWRDLVHPALR